MFNQQAFELLKNTLQDTRSLFLSYFPDWEGDISEVDHGLRTQLSNSEEHYENLRNVVRSLPRAVVLILKDHLLLSYVLFRGDEERDFFCIGPFRSTPLEDEEMIALRRANNLSTDAGKMLYALLQRVPANIGRSEALSTAHNLLLSFFHIDQAKVVNHEVEWENAPVTIPHSSYDQQAKQVEEIYLHEERVTAAITLGNYKKALDEAQFFTHSTNPVLSMSLFPLISARSYVYAANTTFRLAAGRIGIHPSFLHDISRYYAQKIGLCVTYQQLNTVYDEMVGAYCRMCADYPNRQYSRDIQRIMNYILYNLSDDLSPVRIAQAVNFSPSYVSRRFKEEVGMSLMSYISNQRIQAAKQLLSTTQMSIREVSSYVGIPDWNYFTKLFKKTEGCTPSEYQNLVQRKKSEDRPPV